MILALGYMAIVIVCLSWQMQATRGAGNVTRAYVCMGFVIAYIILAMVLWLEVLRLTDLMDGVMVIALLLAIIAVVIIGIIPPVERDGTERRLLWSTLATISRPWRNFAATRQEFAQKIQRSNDTRTTRP